ncbi:uncharacterized protein BDZ99DRAFT_460090 [Mytilinidion resinicola]|uniref:Uncharacterized protein n=1 Tax=Mytilinidion resinicola TaxID=574789 RepID=A0A6A6Z1A2_9PEZI|nr:uncharacterized protein BDZ99DRAFT_460090 [Mytilinidion resinicola]KAF2814443.1 hypothetical protein BDZ99DRAFT_460090 [Mytilinidion resinicola]
MFRLIWPETCVHSFRGTGTYTTRCIARFDMGSDWHLVRFRRRLCTYRPRSSSLWIRVISSLIRCSNHAGRRDATEIWEHLLASCWALVYLVYIGLICAETAFGARVR